MPVSLPDLPPHDVPPHGNTGGPVPLLPPSVTAGKPYALVALLQVHWFIRLRWLFAGGALGALAVERFLLPDVRRPWQLLVAVLCVAGINVVWTGVSRLLWRQLEEESGDQQGTIRSGQMFVSAQIALDLLLLTWILALSGGIESPMALFYLFHAAISGLLLRTWQAAIQCCWGIALYAAMGLAQATGRMAYHPFLPHLGPEGAGLWAEPQHVLLAIAVVGFGILLMMYFTDRIGKVLDRREDMLIRANRALVQSRLAIQDLQQRRSRFMQVAAHQLKSPLAMVQTLTNLVRDGIVTDQHGIQATCEKIVRRCREGIAQVTELLALARVQEADPQRHRAAISDVGAVVGEVCARHAAVAESKRLDFQWDIPAEADLRAHVDRTDLADCIGNLVDNAVKYTPEGGRIEVRVVAGRDLADAGGPRAGERAADGAAVPPPPPGHPQVGQAGYVYVIVADTGIGLGASATLLPDGTPAAGSIFDAFRRGETALAAGIPGSGLGLSIVREVVEQAGGYIHVLSHPGAGTTFTVAFPAPGHPASSVRDTRSHEIVVQRG